MRVLHTTHTMDPAYGGPVTAATEQIRSLLGGGHEVVLLTRVPRVAAEQDLIGMLRDEGAKVVCRPTRSAWAFGRGVLSATRSLVPEVDVAHVHSVYNFVSIAAEGAAHRQRSPVVVQPHGALDTYHHQQKRWKKGPHEWLFERRLLSRAHAVIVTSERERAELLASFPHARTVRIPCQFASMDDLRRSYARSNGDSLIIGYLGRLQTTKRVELLIEAVAEATSAGADVRLRIAGDGSAALRTALVRRVSALEIDHLVEFLGPRYGDDKWAFLGSIDVLCLLSDDESFGIVVGEAALAGCAVVASPRCGIAEYFDDDELVIVEAQSAEAVADAVIRLARSIPETRRLGQLARDRALREFAPSVMHDLLVDVYESARAMS